MNIIDVLLRVDDRLNPALKNIPGSLSGAVLAGNLMAGAFNTAFSAITNGIGAVGNAIAKGIDTQQSIIMTAGSFANAMGASFNEAESYVLKLQGRFAELAASLPGSTDDYVNLFRNVGDDVAAINKEMNNGVFNAKQYEEQITQLVSRFTILGSQPGLTKLQMNSAFTNFFTEGQTYKGFKQSSAEFMSKNAVFRNALEDVLGNQRLEDLNNPQKLEILQKALEITLPQDTLDRLGNTLGGNIESLKTKLFDPTVGLFSFERDLRSNVEGNQNIITALTETTKRLWVTGNSVFVEISKVFKNLGLSAGDPMDWLYKKILEFNSWISDVSDFFQDINYSITTTKDLDLQGVFDKIWNKTSDFLADQAVNFFENIVPKIFDSVISGLAGVFDLLFNNSDSTQAQNRILTSIFTGITLSIGNAFKPENIGQTFKALALVVGGFVVTGVIGAIGAALAGLPLVIIGSVALIASAWITNWEDVKLGASFMFDEFKTSLGNFAQAMLDGMINITKFIADQFVELSNKFGGVFRRLFPMVNVVSSAISLATPTQAPPSAMRFGGGRADGNLPGGIIGDIARTLLNEATASPGSDPVVANTSELILNRAQQTQLFSGLSRGSNNSLNIQSLVVQATSSNPEELSSQIVRCLENAWSSFENSKLAVNS
jgi:hypothetical protein